MHGLAGITKYPAHTLVMLRLGEVGMTSTDEDVNWKYEYDELKAELDVLKIRYRDLQYQYFSIEEGVENISTIVDNIIGRKV